MQGRRRHGPKRMQASVGRLLDVGIDQLLQLFVLVIKASLLLRQAPSSVTNRKQSGASFSFAPATCACSRGSRRDGMPGISQSSKSRFQTPAADIQAHYLFDIIGSVKIPETTGGNVPILGYCTLYGGPAGSALQMRRGQSIRPKAAGEVERRTKGRQRGKL